MVFSPEAVIRVEKKKREKEYDEISNSPHSPFRDALFKDIFLVAMVIGHRRGIRSPLKGPYHDLFRASVLSSNEEWLIKSIAIAEKGDLDVLLNDKEVLKIAEEYANSGILVLYDIIFGGAPGDPLKRIEAEAMEIIHTISRSEEDEQG